MNNKTNIRHWHSTHNDWLRALDFYQEEIGILNERLTEISGKNSSQEITTQAEHFQNAFIQHRNNIEKLEHEIRQSLHKIAGEIVSQTGFVSSELLTQLEKERKVYYEEEREINELRRTFSLFCAEWM